MSALLSPLVSLLTVVLAGAHDLLAALGLAPGSPLAWVLALAGLVVVVRGAMLPLVVHGVRSARARARAMPALTALQRRYAGRRDLESLSRLRRERRAVLAEHGVSSWSLAPMLLQFPLFLALYRVIAEVSAGRPVGALTAGLVASATSATIVGLRLTDRVSGLGASLPGLVLFVGLAVLAAGLTYVTQKWFVLPNTPAMSTGVAGVASAGAAGSGVGAGEQGAGAMAAVQGWLPALSAVGLLIGAAVAPAGLLAYWCLNNLWTLVQQALICRYWPTPGSAAATRQP